MLRDENIMPVFKSKDDISTGTYEGIMQCKITEVEEFAMLKSGQDVLVDKEYDENQVQYYCLRLKLQTKGSKFPNTLCIFGRPENNNEGKKSTLFKINNTYTRFQIEPVSQANGSLVFPYQELKDKDCMALFYRKKTDKDEKV